MEVPLRGELISFTKSLPRLTSSQGGLHIREF